MRYEEEVERGHQGYISSESPALKKPWVTQPCKKVGGVTWKEGSRVERTGWVSSKEAAGVTWEVDGVMWEEESRVPWRGNG